MNEKLHTHLKKVGEEVSLTQEERARMRRTLYAYMEMKPVRTTAPIISVSTVSTFGSFFMFRPVAAVLVLALFISSTGISYAAEDALPGDVLYPIKTYINEPVQGALAVSASAKAAWAANVAGTRVQEAATLAAEGRLSASTQQQLQADFEQHAQVATNAIAETASSSPDQSTEAAVRFEAQLSEYENVLTQIGTAKNIDVASLTSSIKNERGHIAAIRAQTESSDTDYSAATGMGIAARAELDASTKLAHAVSESLSASSAQIVATQLDDASSSISAGDDFAAQSAGTEAINAFQNALATTEKLGVFLNTSSTIHAHTGLVVGEPSTSRAKDVRQNANVSAARPAFTATMITAATTSAEATTTTTITNGEVESGTDDRVQTHGEDEQEGNDSALPTLPVSVPVHFSD